MLGKKVLPMRGAEQGDVDGPLECSLALGMMAAETRMCMAAEQAAGSLPWIGATDDAELQQLRPDHATRLQESANFQLGGPEKRTGARGLADLWYMDDGDIMCSPDPGAVLLAAIRWRQCQKWSGAEPSEDEGHQPHERAGCSTSRVESW